MLQALDDAAVGQWYRAAVEVLSESRGRLDDLNVFPVPDGDTGTNLLLTAQAAVAALDQRGRRAPPSRPGRSSPAAPCSAPAATPARSSPSSSAASPTSSAGQPPADGPAFAAALAEGRRHRLHRGRRPRGGHVPHRRPRRRRGRGRRRRRGAHRRSPTSSARPPTAPASPSRPTPSQLAVLREAGVVDAGGAGLCLVLDALVTTVTGVEPARPPLARRQATHAPPLRRAPTAPAPARAGQRGPVPARRHRRGRPSPACTTGSPRSATASSSSASTPRPAASGTSTSTSPTSAPPSRRASRPAGPTGSRSPRWRPCPPPAPVPGTRAVVAVVPSDGLAELFAGEGVRVVTCGPDGVTRGRHPRRDPRLRGAARSWSCPTTPT